MSHENVSFRKVPSLARITVVAPLLALLISCGGDGPTGPTGGTGTGAVVVTVSPTSASLAIGGTTQLTAAATKDGAAAAGESITFTSGTPAVATVSATGLVTGVAVGTAAITAKATSGASATATIVVTSGPPASITKTAGDNQTGNVGAVVAVAPSVTVKDAGGALVIGATVTFAVASGGGTTTGASALTNTQGVATVGSWTLGATAGANTLTATVGTLAAVTFTATATQPAIALDNSAISFAGAVGAANPAAKTVAVTNGGAGTLTGLALGTTTYGTGATGWLTATISGAAAPATITLTAATGSLAGGTYTATVPVTATGASNSPRTITVTFVVGSPAPASVSFASQQVILAQAATAPTSATVKDAGGSAMSGVAVTYTSRTPTVATVSNAGVITGVAAGQAVIVVNVSPTIADSLLAVVTTPGAPVLISSLNSFNVVANATVTVSIYVDMNGSTKKLSSGQVDVLFSPTQLTYQSNAAGAGVAATVNAAGAATGTIRLSFADATGMSGKVELLKITFKAGATAGTTGTFALTATELNASDFSNLLPSTVKVTQPLIVR